MVFGRRFSAETVYLFLSTSYALFLSLIISVNLVYQTQAAGLNPFQLVMVGTVQEATTFIFEIPTGVIADVKSRRLSVLIGIAMLGAGFVFTGALANFWTILAAQVVIGIGSTFISGARQAWIADEVGVERVGKVYLKATQMEQYGRLLGIPAGIGLGVLSLRLPLIAGGAALMLLALVMAPLMSEEGFKPAPRGTQRSYAVLANSFLDAGRLVRGTPLLMTLFAITAFYGAASEGFGRLWVAHFYQNLEFPALGHFQPVVWFGVIRMGSTLLSLIAVRVLRNRVDTNSHLSVSRWLFGINALQVICVIGFALAQDFEYAVATYWCAIILSQMFDPLYLAWVNQNVESEVRATVISMSSQMDAFGQIGGGPVLGAVGSLAGLRWALGGAALALTPALALYFRAFGQGPRALPAAIDAAAEP